MVHALGLRSVFSGTFDLAGLEAVGVDLNIDVLGAIDELVAHSLVESTRSDIGVRYRLLEPVRHHVLATTPVDTDTLRHRHADHFLGRLKRDYNTLGSTSSDPILALLSHDLDNLRAVHRWTLTSHRISDNLRLWQPLMFACFHDYFEIGDWADETLAVDAIEEADGWHLALFATGMSFIHNRSREHLARADLRLGGDLDQIGRRLIQIVEDARRIGSATMALCLGTCSEFFLAVDRPDLARYALALYPTGAGYEQENMVSVDEADIAEARAEVEASGLDLIDATGRVIADLESVLPTT